MSETMLAAVFKGDGLLVLEQRPVPEIEDTHDVKIAVKGVGVCGTDLHILDVPPRHPATENVILGHEFCGEVIEFGDGVTNCKPGDHVAVDQNAACGHCEECRQGRPNVGIGPGSVIEGAIIDKNARIGACVMIGPRESREEMVETEDYVIRDGVVVISKNAVIPDGAVI